VPSRASLTGDVRATTTGDLDWALERVRALADHDGVELRLESLGGTPPLERTPSVARLAETAIAIGAALGHRLGEAATGGVSDGSWTANRGIPTLDGLGPVGGLDHGPNEYVETASIAPRCAVVAGLVAAIDGGLLRDAGVQVPDFQSDTAVDGTAEASRPHCVPTEGQTRAPATVRPRSRER
jgi:glutamate carboxypeptidase